MDMPVRDDSAREQIVQAGGTPLRIAIRPGTGTGPPLLLCNGIGMRLEAWQPFVDALDPAIEAISFDAPGVGGSQLPSLPYRFTTLALLLRKMLQNLGYQQADVLGVSWGGGLAQQFALLNPRLCRRLILVATATGPQTMVPPNPLPPAKNLILRRWGDLWGGSAKTDPDGLTSALRKARISPLSMGFLYQNTAALGFTTLPLLPLIRQRTLVLTGDDDPIIPVANGRILAAGIPHATLHVYHGGHVELATRPTLLTPLITSFLAAPPHDARRAEHARPGHHAGGQGPRQAADGTAAQATAEADALTEALQAARAAQQTAARPPPPRPPPRSATPASRPRPPRPPSASRPQPPNRPRAATAPNGRSGVAGTRAQRHSAIRRSSRSSSSRQRPSAPRSSTSPEQNPPLGSSTIQPPGLPQFVPLSICYPCSHTNSA
jgi:poly(3-hydroxyalkanoate) depolymerase